MKFRELSECLRRHTLLQIEKGSLTQSRLAELSGFRQAHISNFLNGRRSLSMEGLDRLLTAQSLTIASLARNTIHIEAAAAAPHLTLAPVTTERELLDRKKSPQALDHIALPSAPSISAPPRRSTLVRFAAILLTEPLLHGMLGALPPGAFAVVDRHDAVLPPQHNPSIIHAVVTPDGLRFRHLQLLDRKLLLRPADPHLPISSVPVTRAEATILGRVCALQQPL